MGTLIHKKKFKRYNAPENETLLHNVPLFSELTRDELCNLELAIQSSLLSKRTIIYHEGMRHTGIYCILEGIVKIYMQAASGKQQIVGFATKGDIIAYRSLFVNEPACSTAEVMQDSVMCHISYSHITRLIKSNKTFAYHFIQLMCKELEGSNSLLKNIAQRSVRERTAGFLLFLKDQFGVDERNHIRVSMTRIDLANVLGMVTATLIRVLSDFNKSNIINLIGKEIELIDIDKLHAISRNLINIDSVKDDVIFRKKMT